MHKSDGRKLTMCVTVSNVVGLVVVRSGRRRKMDVGFNLFEELDEYDLAEYPDLYAVHIRHVATDEHFMVMHGGTRAQRDEAKEAINQRMRAEGHPAFVWYDEDDGQTLEVSYN
jgi:hypothetical protein